MMTVETTTNSIVSALLLFLVVVLLLGETPFTAAAEAMGSVVVDTNKKGYTFAVVPKRTNSAYWEAVKSGCETRARRLSIETGSNVTCLFTGPSEGGPDTEKNQIRIVEQLIDEGQIDGLALAVVESASAEVLIEKAVNAGIQVVTFDSDVNSNTSSSRLAYIGTDNYAFGEELGGVLLQMKPEGGTYGIIGARSPNIELRMAGVRSALTNSDWIEINQSATDCVGDPNLAVNQMFEFAAANPDLGAIIPVGAWPMMLDNHGEAWKNFVDENRAVMTVTGDAMQQQMDLMNMGYASALVGQLPFEMGSIAIDKLLEVRQSQEAGLELPFQDAYFPTSFVNVISIPRDLPPLEINMNYIGYWHILGYALFGIILLLSVGFFVFTLYYRSNDIIRKSQPFFLYMICLGILLMGSAIIPLTIDDEHYSQQACNKACMCVPWLLSVGFVTTVASMFSKNWRVNKIFHSTNKFKRIKVEEKDVIVPFTMLMTANIIVLLCWTLIAPLQFERKASSGTDNWNRVYKSYYGVCVSSAEGPGALAFPVIIAVINIGTLLIAYIQAYRARDLKAEYSESNYMAMAMVCMIEALIIGVPVIALTRENSLASFLVFTILIFVTCMAILLLIFVPKILYMRQREAAEKNKGEGRRASVVLSGDLQLVRDKSMQLSDLCSDKTVNGSSSSGMIVPVDGVLQIEEGRNSHELSREDGHDTV